jgi:myosin-5
MAELSYQSMILDRKNQSIIITGESGAGKTESTKIVLRYLANVQKKEFSKESLHAAGASAIVDPSSSSSAPTMHTFDIENKILYTNPVLEAFGNAKTVRNNNSSRFGKFIQIYFNTNQTIYSAEISNYLLEKSRIIMQSPLERNYHIFHMLLHAAPEEFRRKYKVGDEQTFPYVNEQYKDREEFIPVDVEAWEEMNKCMQGLQFTPSEKDGIFRIVGAVLHLGKIDLEGSEDHSSLVAGSESTKHVSELMGITISQLEALLCSKSIIDPSTKKKLTQSVGKGIAEYNRETFSKIVYDKLFDWIVSRVNVEIRKPLTGQAATYKSIGLLDIFGFEIFEVNSFEQLCINFTNEKLQQHFNDHMFKLEQKEYQEEKIDFSGVEFADNLDVINLIEKRPKCIFSFLDEQCAFATGTDHQFWEKIQSNFKNTNAFLAGPKMKKNLFGIAHFAGEVFYDVTNFLDKNKNSKNKDMDEILAGSSVNFISQLFSEKPGSKRAPGQQERIKSVSAQFLDQLDELLKCLNESASLYIRCVKPNRKMAYRVFESELVCKQLRCAGMLEAIRIRKCGFPVRRSFEQFCSANKLLFLQFGVKESSSGSKRAATEQFLKALDKEGIVKAADKTIQIGKTKFS